MADYIPSTDVDVPGNDQMSREITWLCPAMGYIKVGMSCI